MPPKGQRDAERSVTLTQNRKEVDPSTRQCNVCEAFGHTWLECPKGNKNMQKKEIARRAERQARNGARAMMVVGALRVVELEGGLAQDNLQTARHNLIVKNAWTLLQTP